MKRDAATLTFQAEKLDFVEYTSHRIQQGEVGVDTKPMLTLLRSCVCAGFYHPPTHTGALSHITGFSKEGGHCAAGALNAIARQLRRRGVDIEDCVCFLVGGATSQRHVYDAVIAELHHRKIKFNEFDVLGKAHRKLLFDPAIGLVRLYRKHDDENGVMGVGTATQRFNDPVSRVATGASTPFRNKHLLHLLGEWIVPLGSRPGSRIHVWCAGCSVGMEVYSIAMVLLDKLASANRRVPLKVLGSDISPDAIAKAQEGVYPQFDRTPPEFQALLRLYTEQVDGRLIRMGDAVRRVVAFKERDILEGSHRHLFELVICDHVFQYYPEDIQARFLASLVRAVRPGGFLYLSTPSKRISESATESYPFEDVDRSFYRKRF